MEFACLRCRAHVRVSLGENGAELAKNDARAPNGSAENTAGGEETSAAPTPTAPQSANKPEEHQDQAAEQDADQPRAAQRDVATRCGRCDGLYHTSCVARAGVAAQDFQCAACRRGGTSGDVEDDEGESPALLLPLAALGLVDGKTAERAVTDEREDDEDDWVVFTETVEVCTGCRQVHIEAEDRAPCETCHVNGRLHRRCLTTATDTTASSGNRSPGRKRKRSTPTSSSRGAAPVVHSGASALCSSCQGEGDTAPFAIEARRLALLLEKGDRVWWEVCVTCRRDFCLHALAEDGDVEEDSLRSQFGRDVACGFQCRACSETAQFGTTRTVTELSVSFYDQSALPPVDATLGVDPVLEEEGTVLLCDGCEGEFEMATLDPPMLEVPEGDWFCPACQAARSQQHQGDMEGTMQIVTLLICDGCENEFDMATIQPPLAAIPEGDWYCSSCVAPEDTAKDELQMRGGHAEALDSVAQHDNEGSAVSVESTSAMITVTSPSMATVPPTNEDLSSAASTDAAAASGTSQTCADIADGVTLIECDGCDDKFDVTTIRPAAPEVPKGDWFCDTCEATRKRRKKGYVAMKLEKARRLKAMGLGDPMPRSGVAVIPKPVIPRVQAEPRIRVEPRRSANLGLPPPTTVTLLICDGCEGEFDMAMLNPPLSSVPRGDWYCSSCVGSRRKPAVSASMMPCETCSTAVRWNRDAQRAARRRGDMTVLCDPCIATKIKAIAPPPRDETVRDDKKRKRVADNLLPHDGRMQVDPVERIFSPVPVSVSFSSAPMSNASGSSGSANGHQAACGHVVCSDDDGDGMSDNDDDRIIIVCEICLSEFNMIDVLGESQSLTPPPRPWYCMPCLRRLKKNRKKKQRISKQMMLEMQLYGGLLRPTAAKAVDPLGRARRGKKPSSEDELLSLSALVGKRVGVMLVWDKHWTMGRILSFDVTSGAHLIRFDDESEQVLPLFAFPFVVGTSEIIEVMAPASRNQWWPAQVLKMNAIAEQQLVNALEDSAVLKSLRLVSLFSPESRSRLVENVACWAPRHLCRAFSKEVTTANGEAEEDYRLAVIRATEEATIEAGVRASAFWRLLEAALTSGEDVARAVAHALVGSRISRREKMYAVEDFDDSEGCYRVRSDDGNEEQVNLSQLYQHFGVEGARTLGRLQLVLHKAQRGIETSPVHYSYQDTESLDAQLAVLPSSSSIHSTPVASSGHCKKCGLPPILDGESNAFLGEKALVQCIKCDNAFHSYCCDPPHDKFPLVSPEDGSILVEDIKMGFVCRECVTCAGCSTTSSSRWFRWRLPLEVVSLCDNCIVVYDSKCQCAVCNVALDDNLLDDSAALLKCFSCDLWVHPHCEPDPHPAFRRRAQQVGIEFELELRAQLPDLSIKHDDNEDDGEEEAPSGSGKVTNTSVVAISKSARVADEERALELQFKDSYDMRVLNNYECLSCRKVRLLRVLYRLKMEDKLDLFKEPVTKLIAPTYFDVIKQPMDLATMQQKVLDNVYKRVNFRDFRDDFELLCLNAVTFNSRDRDFLIWREAWRFYGQGQKILRQIAPKTRMKRRGGKHYDALVFAAKRQLPNNSQLGKTKRGVGSDGEDDDGDDDDDDDEDNEIESTETDVRDEAELGAGNEVDFRDGVPSVAEQNMTTTTVPGSDVIVEVSAATTRLESNGTSSTESSLPAKPALEKKRALTSNAGVSFTPQNELSLAPKPHSALQFYLTMHSRSGAHTFCWVDACGICGTRGFQDDEMLFCVDCGEGFHTFCCGVDERKFESTEHPIHTYWRCANCEMCELCGKPHDKEAEAEDENRSNRWMQCKNCDRSFHGKCLLPAIGSDDDLDHPDGSTSGGHLSLGDSFYCSSCVACKCCNKTQPRASYSNDRDVCLSCSESQKSEQSLMSAKTKDLLQVWAADTRRQRKDSEKCPMCGDRWTTEDADLIQCDACECWAHPRCDPIFVEDPKKYEDLVNDSNAQYVCSACRSHEREHLRMTPHLAKCQLFLAKIQRTRSQCDARWVEARGQMHQAQIWSEWKDNLAIYLYVLRIGEECLKNLAYRSVNFQEDWVGRSGKHQDALLPSWLFQKAARYLRYKRYARGPRAAARKLTRKAENFYSQQGIEKQKEPHAIATVASQASSCAALVVCVHLLYGWAPLQRVVFHLLEREEGRLSPSLIKSLLVDNNETLEEEIEKIKKQYERRAGKKHLQRLQAEDGEGDDAVMDEEISPTGSFVSSTGPDFSGEDGKPSLSEVAKAPTKPEDTQSGTLSAAQNVELKRPTVHLTRVQPLGTTRGITSDLSMPAAPPAVEDNRYCSLCFIVGDSSACGRLVYVELDQWVHLNCALWSSEVFEDSSGVLQRCQKALSRSKTNRCDGCGVLGATLGCCVSRCPRHYHFPCALDKGVVFLPNGETCCPMPSHVQQVTKRFQLLDPHVHELKSVQTQNEINSVNQQPEDAEPVSDAHEATNGGAIVEEQVSTSAVAVEASAPPPQWSPLVKEPRHCVRVDFSSIFGDTKKRMNALHLKRQVCFRIGALTVHSLGHVVIGNPSFYSRDAVYPLGFRSTRVYWSTRHLAVRCVYECVVTSTDVETRKSATRKDAQDRRFSSPKALFKITASDDKENPIVAASPTEALLELRSRIVSLYEEAHCFSSAEENPFLNRRSWFSYGLLGHHFFGFGIPEIAEEIESLPHVATTAIRRHFILQRHRQQQNQRKRRRGQEVLVDDEEAKARDHVYVFSHRLPPAAEMALAIREVEQVVEAEEHARMSSGAVRTDGLDSQVDEEVEAALRATRRRLNKDATRDSNVQLPVEKTAQPPASASSSSANGTDVGGDTASAGTKEKQAGVPMDLEHLPIAMQYRELRRRPFSERLEVLKSKIHGYGLFTKEKFVEGQMIVEYQGQMISQAVADVREKQYEEMGIGSCYMFRLDERTIIDATRCGNLARFMNHSCDPKAFARVVVVENNEKKIVIFAKRTIEAFEEVTYDYKFPIEDEAIRCDCGAFNCVGRMN